MPTDGRGGANRYTTKPVAGIAQSQDGWAPPNQNARENKLFIWAGVCMVRRIPCSPLTNDVISVTLCTWR